MSKHTPYPTGRTHRGLPVMFNPANGMEFVSFKGMDYTLKIIDRVMDECVRAAAPELLEALKPFVEVWNLGGSSWKDQLVNLSYDTFNNARNAIAKAEGRS